MVNIEGNTRLVQINVDVQNDFCPGGSLAVTAGDEVVPPLNKLAQVVRKTEDGLVIFTQDFHPEQTSHFGEGEGQWPVHCVAGTEGAEFHPDLDIQDIDIIIQKGTEPDEDAYSGFDGTDQEGVKLEEHVTPKTDKETIVMLIGGLATDYCVKQTVLDALKIKRLQEALGRKVVVIVLTDAVRAVNLQEDDGEKALQEMQEAGAILLTTDEAIDRIQNGEL